MTYTWFRGSCHPWLYLGASMVKWTQKVLLYHHLHTTCMVFLNMWIFFWGCFCQHKFLGFVVQIFFHKCLWFLFSFFTNFKVSIYVWITFTQTCARIKIYPLYRACTHLSSETWKTIVVGPCNFNREEKKLEIIKLEWRLRSTTKCGCTMHGCRWQVWIYKWRYRQITP